MGKTNINYVEMSDGAIIAHIGNFIKHQREQQNITQAQLAQSAGLNRWTVSQIENGESVNLSSLLQLLRALDCLFVLDGFEYSKEISPLEYAKLNKRQSKVRVRTKRTEKDNKDDLGW